MADLSQIKESGISVNPDDGRKKEPEKPEIDGEKNKEKSRISEEVKSVLLFTTTSIIAGYLSFVLTPTRPNFISGTSFLLILGTMILILLATSAIVQKIAGKKTAQWIMGNGGAIYLFLWFVSWIIFYNVL